jgi:DNA (cytosine-5)-methyltransferase 1
MAVPDSGLRSVVRGQHVVLVVAAQVIKSCPVAPLVLSLFPGIGLLDMAFEQEGFCVVRGPDVLWGGDIKRFEPPAGVFDGVIGGPPCKLFSRLASIVAHNVATKGYRESENLIPEFERCIAAVAPRWFIMENVPRAPEPRVNGYQVRSLVLNNRWLADAPAQNRVRRFSFGTPDGVELMVDEVTLFENPVWEPAVVASGGTRPVTVKIGGSGKVKRTALINYGYATSDNLKRAYRLQGLPDDFLDEAPFTVSGKCEVVGNGVPLPMGRTIARAVKRAVHQK